MLCSYSHQGLTLRIQYFFFISQTIPSARSNDMAPAHTDPNMPSSEQSMALKRISLSHQGLTPPDSPPTKGLALVQATVNGLKHIFGLFLEKVLGLTNQVPPNTPVSQDQSPPGLDIGRLKRSMVKLTHDECASAEFSLATKPARSSSASNEQEENVQAVGETDLESPICTTPDDFKSFEKWVSKSQFKTVMETYEPPANHPFHFFRKLTRV
jgi:hypothetical protein